MEGLDELHLVEATENENGHGVGTPTAGDEQAALGETATTGGRGLTQTPLPSFIMSNI